MVTKKQINNVLEYIVKNYKVKNHKSDFTEFTYTTLSGRYETIHVIELTQKPTFIKIIKEAKNSNRDKDKWRVQEHSEEVQT